MKIEKTKSITVVKRRTSKPLREDPEELVVKRTIYRDDITEGTKET
jgi:hypothetical protein